MVPDVSKLPVNIFDVVTDIGSVESKEVLLKVNFVPSEVWMRSEDLLDGSKGSEVVNLLLLTEDVADRPEVKDEEKVVDQTSVVAVSWIKVIVPDPTPIVFSTVAVNGEVKIGSFDDDHNGLVDQTYALMVDFLLVDGSD